MANKKRHSVWFYLIRLAAMWSAFWVGLAHLEGQPMDLVIGLLGLIVITGCLLAWESIRSRTGSRGSI